MSELTVRLSDEDIASIAERVAAQLLANRLAGGPEPWVDVHAAAEHLACKPHRIYDLIRSGVIPHRKEGRRILFQLSALDEWVIADEPRPPR